MVVNVLLFGPAADAAGTSKMQVQNVKTTDSLKRKLETDFPGLSNQKYVLAVYKQLANGNESLVNGDTVAVLPPFAGG